MTEENFEPRAKYLISMKKKDNNVNPQTTGDMSPDELIKRLSEYNEKQEDTSSKTELDPEIEKLLKQYVSIDDQPAQAEDLPIMEAPNFDGIESIEIAQEPEQPAAPASYRIRFKIKSHTINGVEVHKSPTADKLEVIEETPEAFDSDDDVLIYQPAAEEFSDEIIPDEQSGDLFEIEPNEEAIDEEFTLSDDVDLQEQPPQNEYDYDDIYSSETIYAENEASEYDITENAEEIEEPVIEEAVQDVAEENIPGSDVTEDSEDGANEPSAEEVIAEYLKAFMAAHSEQKTEPALESNQNPAVNNPPVPENADSGELDETDINLMLALGLEDELAKTVTSDVISDYSEKITRKNSGKKIPTSAEARTTEYVNSSQNREILDEYSKVYSGTVFKIIASLILAVALFCFENISLF